MNALGDLPLARAPFDRDGNARTRPGFLENIRADARTRAVLVSGRSVAVRGDSLDLRPLADIEDAAESVYLGRTPDAPIVAVSVADGAGAFHPLRDAAAALPATQAALATAAVAVLGWHAGSRFCPRCGGETQVEHAGWMRRCPVCESEHFPRTDPAVIVRVTDAEDRILLGSNAAWEAGRYSLFAGFVEAGESLENAVVREVHEEAGVRVTEPHYLGSQPWPFPRSLMLGFAARLDDGQEAAATRADGEEILDVRWFTRAELADPDAGVRLPGRSSIAHAIIDQWLVGA